MSNQDELKALINILYKYAYENNIQPRNTMDLSPLEIWLLTELVRRGPGYKEDYKIIWTNSENDD